MVRTVQNPSPQSEGETRYHRLRAPHEAHSRQRSRCLPPSSSDTPGFDSGLTQKLPEVNEPLTSIGSWRTS